MSQVSANYYQLIKNNLLLLASNRELKDNKDNTNATDIYNKFTKNNNKG